MLHSLVSFIFEVKFKLSLTDNISSSWISKVLSLFLSNSETRDRFISKPITLYFFANSTAKGRPTYPIPIIAIFFFHFNNNIRNNYPND